MTTDPDSPVQLPQPEPPSVAPAADDTTVDVNGPPDVMEQAFTADSLYQLRAAVAAHAALAGLSQQRTGDVVLAAHELMANVIRHGSGQGQLRLWTQNGSLHCQVTDGGQGAVPAPASSPGTGTAPVSSPPAAAVTVTSPGGAAVPVGSPGAGTVPATSPGAAAVAVSSADSGADPVRTPPPWPVEPGHGLWLVCRLTDQATFLAGPPSAATISFAPEPAHAVGAGPWE